MPVSPQSLSHNHSNSFLPKRFSRCAPRSSMQRSKKTVASVAISLHISCVATLPSKSETRAFQKLDVNIAYRYAPFTHDAWTHPETLALISKIAGIDLVPSIDYEIGHINLSVKTDQQTKEELAAINKQKRYFADDEGIAGCPWEDDKPVIGWHLDSYP